MAITKVKVYCNGSGTVPEEVRRYRGVELLAKCTTCQRIGKPLVRAGDEYAMRAHSIPGGNTASHDKTLGILWDHSTEVKT